MQSELELETRTNNEFEEASRRSFSYLTEQVQVLKDAFNKLSDGLLEELDMVSQTCSQRLDRIDSELSADRKDPRLERLLAESTSKHENLIEKHESLSSDVDTLLDVIPRLENKIDAVKKDMDGLSSSVTHRFKDGDSHQGRFEAQLRRFELEWEQRLGRQETSLRDELREDLEQRTLQLQRSITRQLESMNKVLQETTLPRAAASAPPALEPRPDQARRDARVADSARLMESVRADAERFDASAGRGGPSPTYSARSAPAESRPATSLSDPGRLGNLRNQIRLS
jgi:hypothetical protein